jgi:hypothetical protein
MEFWAPDPLWPQLQVEPLQPIHWSHQNNYNLRISGRTGLRCRKNRIKTAVLCIQMFRSHCSTTTTIQTSAKVKHISLNSVLPFEGSFRPAAHEYLGVFSSHMSKIRKIFKRLVQHLFFCSKYVSRCHCWNTVAMYINTWTHTQTHITIQLLIRNGLNDAG